MKVLIATDGSEFSKRAAEGFCQTILKPGDEIEIVAAVEPFTHHVGAPFGVMDDYYRELIKEARVKAGEIIADAKTQTLEIHPDLNLSSKVLIGSPARAVIEEAEEWGAELIVVGTHGRGFWGRSLLGSVSSAVLHHSPCSVLVVRKKAGSVS